MSSPFNNLLTSDVLRPYIVDRFVDEYYLYENKINPCPVYVEGSRFDVERLRDRDARIYQIGVRLVLFAPLAVRAISAQEMYQPISGRVVFISATELSALFRQAVRSDRREYLLYKPHEPSILYVERNNSKILAQLSMTFELTESYCLDSGIVQTYTDFIDTFAYTQSNQLQIVLPILLAKRLRCTSFEEFREKHKKSDVPTVCAYANASYGFVEEMEVIVRQIEKIYEWYTKESLDKHLKNIFGGLTND